MDIQKEFEKWWGDADKVDNDYMGSRNAFIAGAKLMSDELSKSNARIEELERIEKDLQYALDNNQAVISTKETNRQLVNDNSKMIAKIGELEAVVSSQAPDIEQLKINREVFCNHCGIGIITAYQKDNAVKTNCPSCNKPITIDFREAPTETELDAGKLFDENHDLQVKIQKLEAVVSSQANERKINGIDIQRMAEIIKEFAEDIVDYEKELSDLQQRLDTSSEKLKEAREIIKDMVVRYSSFYMKEQAEKFLEANPLNTSQVESKDKI